MTDAMYKTNKACLSQGVGGGSGLTGIVGRHWVETFPHPTQPAALASPFTSSGC